MVHASELEQLGCLDQALLPLIKFQLNFKFDENILGIYLLWLDQFPLHCGYEQFSQFLEFLVT